jgi:hypothetical protein
MLKRVVLFVQALGILFPLVSNATAEEKIADKWLQTQGQNLKPHVALDFVICEADGGK